MIIQSGDSSLKKKKPSWLKEKSSRVNLCPSHPPTPSVCSNIFNCVTEICPRARNQQRSCSSERVYGPGKLTGYKSNFFSILSFWLQKTVLPCRGIPPAAGSLLPCSSLHVLRFAFWWWNFFPFFALWSWWGFPLIYTGFDLRLLCFLMLKKYNMLYSSCNNPCRQWNIWCWSKNERCIFVPKVLRILRKNAG